MNEMASGLTEVTTDTTDRNDRPVTVGGIGNLVFLWLWRWSSGVGYGEGACPSPDYRNKLFVPIEHPFLLPVLIIDYAIIIMNCCTIASKLCLILVTNIFFSQLCVKCLKRMYQSPTPHSWGVRGDFSETQWPVSHHSILLTGQMPFKLPN